MAIKIICVCGNKFLAEAEDAGRVVTCPECQAVLDLSQATHERASPGDEWESRSTNEEGVDDATSDVISEWAAERNDVEEIDQWEGEETQTDLGSLNDDVTAPAMATIEQVFWSLVGVGGIVLVVLSVLGKFGVYAALVPHSLMIPGLTFAYRLKLVAQRKHTHAMRGVANELRLRFAPDGNAELLWRVLTSQLGKVGRAHRLTNLIHGTIDDIRVALFDFEYREGKANPRLTVVCLSWRGTKLPAFSLKPRIWINRDLFEMVSGRNDITFAAHATFTHNYFLRGTNEVAIRKRFTAAVRNFYEQHPGLSTEVTGNSLLYYRETASLKPDDIQTFVTEAIELLALLRRAKESCSTAIHET